LTGVETQRVAVLSLAQVTLRGADGPSGGRPVFAVTLKAVDRCIHQASKETWIAFLKQVETSYSRAKACRTAPGYSVEHANRRCNSHGAGRPCPHNREERQEETCMEHTHTNRGNVWCRGHILPPRGASKSDHTSLQPGGVGRGRVSPYRLPRLVIFTRFITARKSPKKKLVAWILV
jgi:hypothetical protein